MHDPTFQTATALARALLVALLAVGVSTPLSRWLRTLHGRSRQVAWGAMLAAFLLPPLPEAGEMLSIGLLVLKLIPVAAVFHLLAPSALSAEAWHTYRLLPQIAWWERVQFWSHAVGRAWWISAGLACLLIAPGLCGVSVVSLLLALLFYLPFLHALPAHLLPFTLLLTLLLLSLTVLLVTRWHRPSPALHIARQTGDHRLVWDLSNRSRLIVASSLFCWAYFDFTTASTLAPHGFHPDLTRPPHLSAMILAAFAISIFVLLLTSATGRLSARGGHGR